MSQPSQLFHIRCSREDLQEAQSNPKDVFERCLVVYRPEDDVFCMNSGNKARIDEAHRRITFSNSGGLPLDDPESSYSLYTLSREAAYVFFRGLVNGYREGFNACKSDILHRLSDMPH